MFKEVIDEGSRFSSENLQLVTFELSGEEFGVDIMQVSEVISVPRITRIPQAPACIKGLINLRGKILVVIDLNKRLEFSSKETDSLSRIIIVEVKDTVLGMLVNSVKEIMNLPLSSIQQPPEMIRSKINAEYLRGVGEISSRLIILLNLARVLGEEEIEELSELSFPEEIALTE
ncbi:chemotaxis protein CheW [Methanosarcina spelaei]|uniref:Chemotaxis protein CheW n=1 Tax=Methanosarcina spelaei TaxID=1036679 RepID=A0A2A2HNY0_9EURY|nr:chemotaxis protein CheW [Methanosarcina spelaei]PAV11060.1 chemotaxis protein CheW [Methanosarcina spelaei]